MSRLTNRYYSQYDSSIESYSLYDSDNSVEYKKLMNSPSQVEFQQYIQRRKDEEALHESWKHTISYRKNFAKVIEEQCGMKVALADDRVCYHYKPIVTGSSLKGIKFKITLAYIQLLRKWYISLGRTRLPETININNEIKRGTHDPVGQRVLKMVDKVKILLDTFARRLVYVYQVIDKVKETYSDIEFEVNKSLTIVKVLLKEKGWPMDIEKTSYKDIIILKLELDENLQIASLAYEYICKQGASQKLKEMCVHKLEKKLKIFFDFPLMEAFEIFIRNEYFEQVSSSS